MEVIYTERAKQSRGEALLQQATTRLEKVIGSAAAGVQAEWDRTEDEKGHTHYTLRLSDETGTVETTFTPTELRYPATMRVALYHLWGELLKIRSDLQHHKVLALLGALEKEGE